MAGRAEGHHSGPPSVLDEEQQHYLEQLADVGTYSIQHQMVLPGIRCSPQPPAPHPAGAGLSRGFRGAFAGLSREAHPYFFKKRQQQAYQPAREELAEWTAAAGRGELDLAYVDESGFSVNAVLLDAWTRSTGFGRRHLQCLRHAERGLNAIENNQISPLRLTIWLILPAWPLCNRSMKHGQTAPDVA